MKISVIMEDDSGRQFHGEAVLSPRRRGGRSARRGETATHSRASGRAPKPKDALRVIYEKGVFKDEKNLASIQAELAKLEYNFPKSTLMMALGSASYLTRRGTRGNFRWIQKYKPGA